MTDFLFEKRISVSWASSAALHGIFLGLYLIFGPKEKERLAIISEVEFWEPDLNAPQAVEPQESLSQKVFDFLQVKLPSKETKPKELASLPPAAQSADREAPKTPVEKLDLKKNALADKLSASLDLGHQRSADAGPKSLTNFKAPPSSPRGANLGLVPEPKIELSKASGAGNDMARLAGSEGKVSLSSSKLAGNFETLPQAEPVGQALASASGAADSSADEGLPSVPIFNKTRSLAPGAPGETVSESAFFPSKGKGVQTVFSMESAPAVPTGRQAPAALNQTDMGAEKLTEITGPIRNRKIVKMELPEYPAWAKAKGIEAEVVLYFSVTQDGRVNKSVKVTRTSGWGDLDALAIKALAQWVFAPIENAKGDQWGYATFRYVLE